MLRFHPTSPAIPAAVIGLHDKGLVQLDMTSVGGDVDEYELTVAEALRLSQRLRDAATAMQEFLAGRTEGASA